MFSFSRIQAKLTQFVWPTVTLKLTGHVKSDKKLFLGHEQEKVMKLIGYHMLQNAKAQL